MSAFANVDWKKVARERNQRLKAIAKILDGIDERCIADGIPLTHTADMMTQSEYWAIYKLARGLK